MGRSNDVLTAEGMIDSLVNTNQKLRDNIDRILKGCGKSGVCRGMNCRKPIVWMKTKNGKNTPFNYDGSTHWATCKAKQTFKKKENNYE